MSVTVYIGDCRTVLATLPDASVHCCVTSPPYWGLRDYGHPDQIGQEESPEGFVAAMVDVMRGVWRVLRDDGTLWLNLGDSYASHPGQRKPTDAAGSPKQLSNAGSIMSASRSCAGLKPKDLVGIPWRVALALQADGWYLRQDIIWSKPNPMPESVEDRCTKAHEYIFLLSKSERYFYDHEAIKEQAEQAGRVRSDRLGGNKYVEGVKHSDGSTFEGSDTRNKRSVWTIPPSPYREAHFATYPPDLIKPCILAGTSAKGCCPQCGAPWERITEKTPMVIDRSDRTHDLGQTRSSGHMVSPASSKTTGWNPVCQCVTTGDEQPLLPVPCTVLDPFGGSGTTGQVSLELGRSAILIEIHPANEKLIHRRTDTTPGLRF